MASSAYEPRNSGKIQRLLRLEEIMKYTEEELRHLCTRLYFPSINAIVIEEACNVLGDKLADYFDNERRVTLKGTGVGFKTVKIEDAQLIQSFRVMHKMFYLDKHERGFNNALKIEWKIEQINVLSNTGKKFNKPLHKFIFDHCNPDGYWLLERSVMETI